MREPDPGFRKRSIRATGGDASVQRLDLDDLGRVVAAGPERDRGGRVVDEHAAQSGCSGPSIAAAGGLRLQHDGSLCPQPNSMLSLRTSAFPGQSRSSTAVDTVASWEP